MIESAITPAAVGLIVSSRVKLTLERAATREVKGQRGTVLVKEGFLSGRRIVQIGRSHPDTPTMPHKVDNMQNLEVLKGLGVTRVLATGMVGSLVPELGVGDLVVPDQLIDLSMHEPASAYRNDCFGFADCTDPYCDDLRTTVLGAARGRKSVLHESGTYFCMRGPRYETAAEARMLATLGGTVVGSTGGPECTMARELGLCYAMLGVVSNIGPALAKNVTVETVASTAAEASENVAEILTRAIGNIDVDVDCGCRSMPTMFGTSSQQPEVDENA